MLDLLARRPPNFAFSLRAHHLASARTGSKASGSSNGETYLYFQPFGLLSDTGPEDVVIAMRVLDTNVAENLVDVVLRWRA
jgi:hypothetical protein